MSYSVERLPMVIQLGRETETGVQEVRFDVSGWLEKWPGMRLSMLVRTPGGNVYPAQTAMDGAELVWRVSEADTAVPGVGGAEIVGELDGVRKVSGMVSTRILPRMAGTVGDVPGPAQAWVAQVQEAAQRAESGAQAAQDSAGQAAGSADNAMNAAGTAEESAEASAQSAQAAQASASAAAHSAAAAQAVKDSIPEDYNHLSSDVGQLKDEIADNAEADAATKRSLDALWKLNQGISYQFEMDGAESYQKTVPSGAKLASVQSIGGHTEVIDGELVSADVESVIANGRNSVKDIIENSFYDGRGNVAYSDTYCRTDKFAVKPSTAYFLRIDNSSMIYMLQWDADGALIYRASMGIKKFLSFTTNADAAIVAFFFISRKDSLGNVMFPAFSDETVYIPYRDPVHRTIPAAVRNLPGYGWSAGSVANTIERMESGWQYIQRVGSRAYQDGDAITDGVHTYYELAEPIITNITELMLDALEPFDVEGGGTLTFTNAAQLPVPSSVEYIVSLAEVGV